MKHRPKKQEQLPGGGLESLCGDLPGQDLVGVEQEKIWFLRFKQDPEEFEWIVDKYSSDIRGYLFRRTKDAHVAGELTQDTFVRTFTGFMKFEWRGLSLTGFLFKTARNVYSDWYKAKKKSTEFSLDSQGMVIESGEQTDEAVLRRTENEIVDSCLTTLSDIEREIVDLHYWGGLDVREVAIVIKMKEGTVKSHLKRGRHKIKQELEIKDLDHDAFSILTDPKPTLSLREDD